MNTASGVNCYPSKKRSLYRIHSRVSGVSTTFGRLLARVYSSVIAGTWSIMVLLPVESLIGCKFGSCEGNIYHTSGYAISVGLFTLLFFSFFSVLPFINRHNVKRFLRKKMKDCVLTPKERNEAFEHIIKGPAYFNINTKNGFMRFALLSLFNLTIAALFFGIEDGIRAIRLGRTTGISCLAQSVGMFMLSGVFYCGWLAVKREFNAVYRTNYLNRNYNPVATELFSHLCDIATMNGIEGCGMGDLSIKESIENAINLSKVYYVKAQQNTNKAPYSHEKGYVATKASQ